jgi:hypothetical protein
MKAKTHTSHQDEGHQRLAELEPKHKRIVLFKRYFRKHHSDLYLLAP